MESKSDTGNRRVDNLEVGGHSLAMGQHVFQAASGGVLDVPQGFFLRVASGVTGRQARYGGILRPSASWLNSTLKMYNFICSGLKWTIPSAESHWLSSQAKRPISKRSTNS